MDKVSNFFALWAKSIRALFGKFFAGLSQLPSASPEECFAEDDFFARRNFALCINFAAAATFLFFGQSYLGVSKQQFTCVEEKWKIYSEKLLCYFTFLDF